MKNIKSYIVALVASILGIAPTASAQKLPSAQVPEAVRTAFEKAHPMAMDVEWKLSGDQYKVEFEIGLFFTDHEAWYDATGKLIRHEEEISSSDLPTAVTKAIAAEFPGYRIDDTERITLNGTVSYIVELKMKGYQEWKVAYDANGKQLQKQAD
ncbi:MAG: hypothetical protein E6Q44_10690 [Flavobacteriales bacterium]|jgi:uncharacterized membrane protein YkoI|nr:MAG: hypothetical protein E6Q44_10690 [Flavobacteriales bacterium]